MTTKASWWLKLDRAEKHLHELDDQIVVYAKFQPYRAVRDAQEKRHPQLWRYRLAIDIPPDPSIAMIFGDVIHSIRSALDHLAVGISDPRRIDQAKFMIKPENPWAKKGRRYRIRKPEVRKSFNSALSGMAPEAAAIIKRLQPYQDGARAEINPLGIINRLENADKHRQLVPITPGIKNLVVRAVARGRVIDQTTPPFCKNGAVIAEFGEDFSPPLLDDEVDVDVYGTPVVAVQIASAHWYVDPADIRTTIAWLRADVFPALEAWPWVPPHVG